MGQKRSKQKSQKPYDYNPYEETKPTYEAPEHEHVKHVPGKDRIFAQNYRPDLAPGEPHTAYQLIMSENDYLRAVDALNKARLEFDLWLHELVFDTHTVNNELQDRIQNGLASFSRRVPGAVFRVECLDSDHYPWLLVAKDGLSYREDGQPITYPVFDYTKLA